MTYDAFSGYHPAVNFLFFCGAIGFGVVIQHPAYILAGLFCSAAYTLLLKRRSGLYLVISLIPLFLAMAALNPLLNTQGYTVLFRILGRPYTMEALIYGMAVSGIFVLMLLWFSCYGIVLTSDKLICLFGSLFPSLSMLVVMVLRLIPSFFRRGQQILDDRNSIGKGFEGTGCQKIQSGMSILSSLTDWALEGSISTADSMRSRGYGSGKRTHFHTYRITIRDWLLLVLMMILSAVILLSDGKAASYTPELTISPITGGLAAYIILLSIPLILHIVEVLRWHISLSKI